ncbi:MAG: ATP-binding protein [Firmicutes bacterium]|nr:ATP-binding protein [Bacillota bacterium]
MNTNIYNLIKKEYEKKQRQAYEKLMDKKKEVFSAIPELEEIENKIQASGLTYSKLILSGKKSWDTEVSALLLDMEKLRNRKKLLLEANHYPQDYLEPEYECEKCKDTGFIDDNGIAVKCHCYRQKLINYLYDQSNLSLVKLENFNTFNEKYYPDIVDEKRYGIKISPRENILKIKDRCIAFINNFDSRDEKNLFFSGPPGVGKTFMASCIARELLNMGKTVLYQTAPVMFSTINEYKFRFSGTEEYSDTAYRNIFEVELLIIDDLGIEPTSPARYAELLTILNTRQANNLTRPCKTIISTNIGPKQLYEYYTERVVSRIVGYFDRLIFAGEDIRTIRK